jgi:hypothetical protein
MADVLENDLEWHLHSSSPSFKDKLSLVVRSWAPRSIASRMQYTGIDRSQSLWLVSEFAAR